MNKYEAMFILKPDLPEEEKKTLLNQVNDAVTKHSGKVISGDIWSEKKKLYFVLKKYREGTYYLMHFNLDPLSIKEIRQIYKLNENILRVLITKMQ